MQIITLNDDVLVTDSAPDEGDVEPYVAVVTKMWTDAETAESLVKCKWYFTRTNIPEDALEAYEARQSLLNNEVSGAPATAKKKVLLRLAEESIGLTC